MIPDIPFQPFPKIPRLRRDCTITEKIDGTNASILIEGGSIVGVASRKRWITPDNDNFGFAAWVHDNAMSLAADLGDGHHFGEWWGSGIGRAYDYALGFRRFSLFNTKRWQGAAFSTSNVDAVPVVATGQFSDELVSLALAQLELCGSYARQGFARPEGVIIYHHASGQLYKVLLENDELPKGVLTARERELASL